MKDLKTDRFLEQLLIFGHTGAGYTSCVCHMVACCELPRIQELISSYQRMEALVYVSADPISSNARHMAVWCRMNP